MNKTISMSGLKNVNRIRFTKYLYKYWKLQVITIILGFITLPFSLVNPYLTKLIIDKAYNNRDMRLFLILAVMIGGILIFNALISSLAGYLSHRLKRGVNFDMTLDLFKHFHKLPASFFEDKAAGGHVYRITGDVNSVSVFICDFFPRALELMPRFIFVLAIVFYLNWKLALFAILIAPITYLHAYFFGKWIKESFQRLIEKFEGIFISLHEIFSHINLIKVFGKEEQEVKRLEENLSKNIALDLKNEKLSSMSGFSGFVVNSAINGSIVLYGGYQVIKGNMTLGSLTAIMIYAAQLIGLIESIGGFYENIVRNSISQRRLAEILDIKPAITDREDAIDYHFFDGKIEFREVTFRYHKEGNYIFENMHFLIPPYGKIALVGSSGCGKTTLLSLILRLYEAENGSILIDGFDIKEMKLYSLKSQIGIALQEPFLWNDTVKNNVLYAKEDASTDEIVRAARIAEAHDFIMALPKGYDTVIGENACKISEGQKQRIAIARAVIKRPKILILDEAMSSLDSKTEDAIIGNLKREFINSTIIVVSHRFSAIKNMDIVCFLETPHSMEIDKHERLIEKNIKYRELLASQIKNICEAKTIFEAK